MTQIQFRYFDGSNYLSIEGVILEFYKKYDDRKVLRNNTVGALIGDFHYYLSDDSNQY